MTENWILAIRILLAGAGLSLVASLVSETIFNAVILKSNKFAGTADAPDQEEATSAGELYRQQRPPILRRIRFLDYGVRFGSVVFFLLFCLAVLALAFLKTESIGWTLLSVPGLVFLYFIGNLVSMMLATLLVRRGAEEEHQENRQT